MRKRRKKRLTVEEGDWLRVIESATYVGDKEGGSPWPPQNGPRYFDLGRGGTAPARFMLLSQIGDKDRIAGLGAARADQLPSIA